MGDVELLDSSLIPHFTEAEEAEYQRLVAAGKEAIKPTAAKVRKQYTDRQVDEAVARTGKSGTEAREAIERTLEVGELDSDFLLHLDSGSSVTVGQILANRAKYHNTTLADPIEPEYGGAFGAMGRCKAKMYLLDGGRAELPNPIIHSFAHGGRNYYLIGNADPVPVAPVIKYYKHSGGKKQVLETKLCEDLRAIRAQVAIVIRNPGLGKTLLLPAVFPDRKMVHIRNSNKSVRELAGVLETMYPGKCVQALYSFQGHLS